MKTELSDDGTLTIWPESTVESFALKHWFSLWGERKAVLRAGQFTVEPTVPVDLKVLTHALDCDWANGRHPLCSCGAKEIAK